MQCMYAPHGDLSVPTEWCQKNPAARAKVAFRYKKTKGGYVGVVGRPEAVTAGRNGCE